ncbi:MAG: hypothetical protein ACYCPD_01065 [Acidobacteriaceae bacterium]
MGLVEDSVVHQCSLEHWYYIAGIGSSIAALLGLFGLGFYACETYRLRKVSQEQLEASMIPCVLALEDLSTATFTSSGNLILSNVGVGVALNIRCRYEKENDTEGKWHSFPALSPKGTASLGDDGQNLMIAHGHLVCEFESLSGRRYSSGSWYEGSQGEPGFKLHHRFNKL